MLTSADVAYLQILCIHSDDFRFFSFSSPIYTYTYSLLPYNVMDAIPEVTLWLIKNGERERKKVSSIQYICLINEVDCFIFIYSGS
jgi:hypothetical protein